MLLGMHWPDVEPEILGPWRPAAFVLAWLLIALPNAFIATAVQFAFAALGRRAIVGYFGSVVLFFASMGLRRSSRRCCTSRTWRDCSTRSA